MISQQRPLNVEEICKKLKPIFGNKIDQLYLKYSMSQSREEKEGIAGMLFAVYNKNLGKLLEHGVLLEPPTPNSVAGEYPLAIVKYSNKKLFPFNLRENDWPRHVCVSGMSGSGKTTFAFQILKNFVEKNKNFLVFDWKKSFRPLLKTDSEIMLFTVGNDEVSNLFRLNLNEPPKGVAPREWINVLCDLLTESFFASYGVHKVLLETLDDAFEEWGVYKGSNNYPTWKHIKWRLEQKLDNANKRESAWVESALRIASILTFGSFGEALSYKEKGRIKVEDLFSKKVIFELNSLSSIEKKFFCEFVLTYMYKAKKANQQNFKDNFDYAIIVDEAHNIFLKEQTHFVKESVTDMIYRELREYGISLICLDQHISKLSDTVKGNSACHVAFQQQLPQDILDIAGIMNLVDRKEFFSGLPVGTAVVKLAERYTIPFLVETPNTNLRNENVSDLSVKERMKLLITKIELDNGDDDEFKEKFIPEKEVKFEVDPTHIVEIKEVRENKDVFKILDEVIRERKNEKPLIKEVEEKIAEADASELINVNRQNTIFNVHDELKQERIINSKNDFASDSEQVNLTKIQKVLYDFVKEKLREGRSLREINDIMEDNLFEKLFSVEDIDEVINFVILEMTKEKKVKIVERVVEKKIFVAEENDFSDDEAKFLLFLKANPNHNLSTVEFYKVVGLSARKGNQVKNNLLNKGMIKIEEIKNENGWKKFVRLREGK